MASCRAVIFDLGRVLVRIDTGRGFLARLTSLTRTADPDLLIRRLLQDELFVDFNSGRLPPAEFHVRISRRLGLDVGYEDFRRIWCDIFQEQPGMDALLRTLAPVCRIGLLSDTDPLHWEWIRATYPYVASIPSPTLSFETGFMKPDPRAYEAAATRTGVAVGDCLFIDDLPGNVEGARRVGMDAVLFVDMDTLWADLRARNFLPEGGAA